MMTEIWQAMDSDCFALDVDMLESVDGERLRAELSELDREGEGEAECERSDFFFFFFLSGGDDTVELTPPLAVVETVSRRFRRAADRRGRPLRRYCRRRGITINIRLFEQLFCRRVSLAIEVGLATSPRIRPEVGLTSVREKETDERKVKA